MSQENVELVKRCCRQVYRGHDGVRKSRAEVLAHSKRFEIEYELQWAAVWTTREGKLVEAEGYLHMADALEAAGLG